MIYYCFSFFSDIVSDIGHEEEIVYSKLMWELIFDDSDLLCGEEDSRSIEE